MIWIPYRTIVESAEALDLPELQETYESGMTALRAIILDWGDDLPAFKKFRNSLGWLRSYVASIEMEIQGHGLDPDPFPIQTAVYFLRNNISMAPVPPPWLGDRKFHLHQMSNLIRVNPTYYAQRLPAWVPLDLPVYEIGD